ncbi:hypothetical protein P608_19575 [Comamonas thiooxydans]|uniref:Uncharacterized protein n=1 Tax=Comamonas thiooxydans TaxID=363952 RepID=A0A0E3BTK6_9BURK|nr:hypothetical protein P245_21495 [Comamonas thiooxydans]KGG88875.1 hypothetical protein P609_05585 [Comamonas thiooxydans]KGH07801.1 hypothetical protein P608_19575 [Comamonas thiooxydans]KGH16394.1 hypothetical protein P607_20175 [Comamonas thiooxydans]KGH20830.1 hypothetical protein P606_19360 [Comamonas thiooxydans]
MGMSRLLMSQASTQARAMTVQLSRAGAEAWRRGGRGREGADDFMSATIESAA